MTEVQRETREREGEVLLVGWLWLVGWLFL